MNADKRGLKRIGLSEFIGVDRRLKMPPLTFSAASFQPASAEPAPSFALSSVAALSRYCRPLRGTEY